MADVDEGSFKFRDQPLDPDVTMTGLRHRVQKQLLLILNFLHLASEDQILILNLVVGDLILNISFKLCVLDEMPISNMDERQFRFVTIDSNFHRLNAREGAKLR